MLITSEHETSQAGDTTRQAALLYAVKRVRMVPSSYILDLTNYVRYSYNYTVWQDTLNGRQLSTRDGVESVLEFTDTVRVLVGQTYHYNVAVTHT